MESTAEYMNFCLIWFNIRFKDGTLSGIAKDQVLGEAIRLRDLENKRIFHKN